MGDLTRSSESLGQAYPTRRQLRFKIEHQKARILAERHRKIQRALSVQIDSLNLESKILELAHHYQDSLGEREQGFRLADHASKSETKEADAAEDNAKLRWRYLTERFLVFMERKVKEAGLKHRGPKVGSSQHAQEVWRGKAIDEKRKEAKVASSALVSIRKYDSKSSSWDNDGPASTTSVPAPVIDPRESDHMDKVRHDSAVYYQRPSASKSPKIRYQHRAFLRIRDEFSHTPKLTAQRLALGMRKDDFTEMKGAWGSLKAEDWEDDEVDDGDGKDVSEEVKGKWRRKLEDKSKREMWDGVQEIVKPKGRGGEGESA